MSRYEELKKELLSNPEVREAYDDLGAEFDIIQADISRIENGTRNPSLAMLKRLAKGMEMQLRLEFIPRKG